MAGYSPFTVRWTRRRIVQALAAGAGGLSAVAGCRCPAAGGVAPVRSIPDYRRPDDRDDSAAFGRAIAAGGAIYFPAGRGMAPDGAYLLRPVSLRSETTLYGDGARSVLRPADPAVSAAIATISEAVDRPLRNIAMRDLRIEGWVAETGFREHWNLVALSGVDGLRIERVQFIGFTADGLYLGAERAWPTREPRIIRNVLVRECLFDGLTNDNRNAISVTGGSSITIERCRFRRCSRPNMPGPIDFEPDPFPFYRLERIRVTDCDFEDCGGNVGQIGFMVPSMVPPPRGIVIARNRFSGYRGTGGEIAISINREPDAAMASMECVIEGNVGSGGYGGVQIFSARGVTVRDNRWTNYASRGFFGSPQSDGGVLDATLSDRFDRCGWHEGIAFALYKGENVRIEANEFRRTGNGAPGSAPLYVGPGRIRKLAIVGNDFRGNPMALGVVTVERGTDYIPATTDMTGNLLPSGRVLPAL